jgi:hypothetical protein
MNRVRGFAKTESDFKRFSSTLLPESSMHWLKKYFNFFAKGLQNFQGVEESVEQSDVNEAACLLN